MLPEEVTPKELALGALTPAATPVLSTPGKELARALTYSPVPLATRSSLSKASPAKRDLNGLLALKGELPDENISLFTIQSYCYCNLIANDHGAIIRPLLTPSSPQHHRAGCDQN